MPEEYFFNGEFDAGLGRSSVPESLIWAAERMSQHFLLAAGPCDSIMTRRKAPPAFSEHLKACGVQAGNFIPPGRLSRDACFVPFGWDEQAVSIQSRHHADRQKVFPALPVVRTVNSKLFSLEIARCIQQEVSESRLLESKDDVLAFMEKRKNESWVLKSLFGSAGAANKRIGAGKTVSERWIDGALMKGGAVIAEPWRNRTRDFGVSFNLNQAGELRDGAIHELLNTPSGKYRGVILEKDPPISPGQRDALFFTVEAAGKALCRQGYFGPAGIDAFEWRDSRGVCHLRSLVEINARHSMTLPAYRLKTQLGNPGCLVWRIYSGPYPGLPSSYKDWTALENQVKNNDRVGVVPVSPIQYRDKGRSMRRGKQSIAFFGKDRASVMNVMGQLENQFRLV